MNQHKHTMIGLSGGVDSSVAAFLLKEQGFHVEAVFMKNWEENDAEGVCTASRDLLDAQAVAEQLQIELHQVNFVEEYWQHVFSIFLAEYKAGFTPNPDILCNKEIKFKAFLNFAKRRGADTIATGHYARSIYQDGQYQLLKALDLQKDQSYFLHALNQEQLSQSIFPIGELTKPMIRQMAKKIGLKNHAKKDSTGICFIGERKFKTFLNDFLPAKPGPIQTLAGEVIGQHDGLMFYTIGQRQGLKIGGQKNALDAPWYVAHKDMASNSLVVVQGASHPALFTKTLSAHSVHWIANPLTAPKTVYAKTRYRQSDQACKIWPCDQDRVQVEFFTPQRAVTPGQSVVFYDNDQCLGGGIIQKME